MQRSSAITIKTRILRRLAVELGHWPYALALNLTQFFAKVTFGKKVEIWPRNSYVLGSLQPGYSDLDLTLFQSEPLPRPHVERFLQQLQSIRPLWPFLGEVNFYRRHRLELLEKIHNVFELERDPILLKYLQCHREGTAIEAAVFLLRQLEKDLPSLRVFPKRRRHKWLPHYIKISQKFAPFQIEKNLPFDIDNLVVTIRGMILYLCGLHNPLVHHDLAEKLGLYLELVEAQANFQLARPLWDLDPWFFVWMAPKGLNSPLPSQALSENQLQFFVAQMHWEIAGILSQSYDKKGSRFARNHYQQLREMTDQLHRLQPHPALGQLSKDFTEALLILDLDAPSSPG